MAFIDLDRLHLEVGEIALIHKEVQGSDQVPQIRIDADIIIKSGFQMKHIVLIRRCINVLDRHLGVEELIELHVALPIVIDSTFS